MNSKDRRKSGRLLKVLGYGMAAFLLVLAVFVVRENLGSKPHFDNTAYVGDRVQQPDLNVGKGYKTE